MTEIEKIFEKHSTITVNTFVGQRRVMTSDQFTQALAEVFEMVKPTDKEAKDFARYSKDRLSAIAWTEELRRIKLERLLK
jgi:hypothetical protein